ncbi:tetratricopeptide repeat protein [Streptomyces sp. MW-W600-10]|uniref:tetratricopeptide repeat protein n=1 Tax=Streptomyces sp. MW-W600-10 TaxID=2829819 RepID=UPI001C455DDB|nr:tetratricopeptide repeat protein [Streptomyces sp. MW-W600-10]MBV7243135.1 tetratricopeptide repeat protein [Streptomyces sp. MW-W600-10]
MAAIMAVLGAIGSGVASEAGKAAWDSAGVLVRRLIRWEVVAPVDLEEREALARLIYDSVRSDPEAARLWRAFVLSVQMTPPTIGRPRLPASVHFFTDREGAMKLLDREAARKADGRPRVALVHGDDAMGTSTLAVHWGWRAERRFPDGQLYVDLRRRSAGGIHTVATALRYLLRQLGLEDEQIPPVEADRIETFRRVVADRELLLVLDHARSADQIAPLLTSAPSVLTLVVAQRPLPGLDALPVPVGPLSDRDAARLLTKIVGKQVMRSARAVLPALLQRCGGSPCALRASVPQLLAPGAHTLTGPPFSPVQRSSTAGLAANDGNPMRTAAAEAYRLLAPEAARLYRLMALRDWPAFDAEAAAHVASFDVRTTEVLLEGLAEVLLLEHAGDGRYRYRSAVRAHAEQVAYHQEGIAGCWAAMTRAMEYYLRLSVTAARAALPESWRVPDAPEGGAARNYSGRGQALGQLAVELPNLVEAIATAEECEQWNTVLTLCRALWPLQLKAGHHDVVLPVLRIGARVADTRAPGSRAAGALHAQLSHTLRELQLHDEAGAQAAAAVRDERAAGHMLGLASAIEFLGLVRLHQWRHQHAYDCFDEARAVLSGIGSDDDGVAHVSRARALLDRHLGRALLGLVRLDEAQSHVERALEAFRAEGEAYNTARALTDLAEILLVRDERASALPLIDEAIRVLTEENADQHVDYLRRLRAGGAGLPG